MKALHNHDLKHKRFRKNSLLSMFLATFLITFSLQAQNNTNYGENSGTKGSNNAFFGYSAGRNITSSGADNSFFGKSAGHENTHGTKNTFLGRSAGYNNIDGRSNTMVGYEAGYDNVSGVDNTYIGREAGHKAKGSGNVFIGHQAGFDEDGDNKLYINNSQSTPPMIYGEFGDPDDNKNHLLGINTRQPGTALHVKYGYYSSEFEPTNVEGLFIENRGDNNLWYVFQTANKLGRTFSITNAGQVGIGTASPHEKLTLKNGNFLMKVANNSNNQNILFQNSGNTFVCNIYRKSGANNSADLVFATGKNTDYTQLTDRMIINSQGNVGIGTNDPQSKFAVNGKITTTSIEVTQSGWPDFVFEEDYKLRTLQEVEEFIQQNHHLPDVPSEAEISENGLNLGDMNALLLQKVEELTLYVIELKKELDQVKKER